MAKSRHTLRQIDIDWLRILATLVMFLRHCARFFNYSGWHVKNNQLSYNLSIFVSFVDQWVMPLFFVLAAMSTFYALAHMSETQYLNRRVKRLLVPFLFGVLVIIPPQFYLQDTRNGWFNGSYLEFMPVFFADFRRFLLGNLGHLWYLEMLFIFSILFLPIFMALRYKRLSNLVEKMAVFFQKPMAIFLFAIPMIVAEIIVAAGKSDFFNRTWGSWNMLTYAVFFGLGYLIAMDPRYRLAIERYRLPALIFGILITLAGLAWFLSDEARIHFPPGLRALSAWCWLVAILGYGSKHLNRSTPFYSYVNEAVLPFYILHQTVIIIIGYMIADWDMRIAIKFLFLTTTSFIAIMGIYHFGIRKLNLFRILFGMKPTPRPQQVLVS